MRPVALTALTLQTVTNLIDGEVRPAESGEWLEKLATG